MKLLTRSLFAAYIVILLWLVLFKFSYEPLTVIRDVQLRSLNLIPFAWTQKSEAIANLVAFIPLGVMLGVSFKRAKFRYKLAVIFASSLAVEISQYVLAIGITDITDLIMNTLGGFVGLAGYAELSRHTNEKILDAWVLAIGTLAIMAVLFLRVFVFIVRY